MGKVRGLRTRVHQAAVRPAGAAAPLPAPPLQEAAPPQTSAGGVGGKEWALVNTDLFARTEIDPSTLVQKLDLDTWRVPSIRRALGFGGKQHCAGPRRLPPTVNGESKKEVACRGHYCSTGAETKAVLPKKEKRKLRRERWLQKIEAIKLAEQKRQAERKRRATVVVGDLQPLRDALPELLELEAGARRPHARSRASSVPRPAELSRMSAAQRLQLLEEERTRFRELLASPIYRASPLLAIGQQLAQRMQLDGGGLL
ncbi:ribosome biogenesis protein SLX9 homolog isoform X3 [Rhinolophus ferrumequinum]|uniref:SLX9 ribosome biosis factor n=1 Tax=Rhinolophus ferrumequinum TaxID=59479 RepID=A0A671DM28_RHIFE|nr:ribosome biogenesis protein SLX9 homolog isoform X3 [Rhinolophus ferrumequinum]